MNRLKELRTNHGLSQEELGDIVNVSQQTISRYEKTNANIPIDILIRLSQYFGIPIEYLLDKTFTLKSDTPTTAPFQNQNNILELYQNLDEINQQTVLILGNRLLDIQTYFNKEMFFKENL